VRSEREGLAQLMRNFVIVDNRRIEKNIEVEASKAMMRNFVSVDNQRIEKNIG
jgi:hypothetical protein